MVGFVDDSTGQVNDFDTPQEDIYKQLLAMMDMDAQLWASLLVASGGKLELAKCSFHLLIFLFDASGKPHPDVVAATMADLNVWDDTTGQQYTIKAKSPFAAHKTLGHWKAPAGQSTSHYNFVLEKCKGLLNALTRSHVTRPEAHKFYQALFLPAMAYSLGQSHLSETQLGQLDKTATSQLLATHGYNRCTARAIVFAPKEVGGINFYPFQVIQGFGQIRNFLQHWRVPDTIGKALRVAIKWEQYQSGSGYAILTHPTRPIPEEETRWIRSLRKYLYRIAGHMELDDPGVYPLQRQNDQYLIDIAIDSEEFSPTQLQKLNYCRLWLNVTTISDIALANGTHLDDQLRCGNPSLLSSQAKWRTVHQADPNPNSWSQWDRLLDIIANDR